MLITTPGIIKQKKVHVHTLGESKRKPASQTKPATSNQPTFVKVNSFYDSTASILLFYNLSNFTVFLGLILKMLPELNQKAANPVDKPMYSDMPL